MTTGSALPTSWFKPTTAKNLGRIAAAAAAVALMIGAVNLLTSVPSIQPSATDLATPESAKAFAYQLVLRPKFKVLRLSGTQVMPDTAVIDILQRALNLNPGNRRVCTIVLDADSTAVDYQLSIALAPDRPGSACMLHSTPVPGGGTVLDLHLAGKPIPAFVRIFGVPTK